MINNGFDICEHCQASLCYRQDIEQNLSTWLCLSCGFTTSDVLTEGSQASENAIATAPELYKDLMYVDKNKRIWLPATMSVPEKGMVFVDGTNKQDWRWAAVKAITVTEKDKKISPDQTHKMDMKNVQYFGRESFIKALENIEFLNVD